MQSADQLVVCVSVYCVSSHLPVSHLLTGHLLGSLLNYAYGE